MRTLLGFYFINHFRNINELYNLIIFYVISMSVVAYGLSHETDGLAQHALSLMSWIAILFCIIIDIESIFNSENEEGALDEWRLSPLAMEWIVLMRLLALWCCTIVPLLFIAALALFLMGMDLQSAISHLIAQGAGSISMLALASVGGAVLTGENQRMGLLTILIIPLQIPIILLGIGSASESDPSGTLMLLCGLAMLCLPLAALANAALLREG